MFFQKLVEVSVQSWGLIPFMLVIFMTGLAIIVERTAFFTRTFNAGISLEYDLQKVGVHNEQDATLVMQHYDSTVQAELIKTALISKGKSAEALERDLDEAIMFQVPKLDRNLWLLDTAVTLGPLLGLLGTIIGMIESFSILDTSGKGNPGAVTGGIGHALIATGIGLCIAIFCVVFLNYFNKRTRMILNQLDLIKLMLISRFSKD